MRASVKILIGGFVCLAYSASLSLAATRYVDINNPTPVAPYTSWATAANDLQSAINAAMSNDTVLVTNGTYKTTTQIQLQKCLEVRSVNGPEATVVDAAPPPLVEYHFNDPTGTDWKYAMHTGTDPGQWNFDIPQARTDGTGHAHMSAVPGWKQSNHVLATPITGGTVMLEYRLSAWDLDNSPNGTSTGFDLDTALKLRISVAGTDLKIRASDTAGSAEAVLPGEAASTNGLILRAVVDLDNDAYHACWKRDTDSSFTVLVPKGTYAAASIPRLRSITWSPSPWGAGDFVDIDCVTLGMAGSCRVFNLNSNNGSITLEGFTVTGGFADYGGAHGGGMYVNGSEPIRIENCIVENNIAPANGGGMQIVARSLTEVENCIVRNNSAGGVGGGAYVSLNSSNTGMVTIANCLVAGNRSGSQGGGLRLLAKNPSGLTHVLDCRIFNNSSVGAGGGAAIKNGIVENCIIDRNTSSGSGGGLAGNGHVQRCLVANNHADNIGGGLDAYGIVADSLITGNTSGYRGGGLRSSSRIINCTVVGNSTTDSGGGTKGGHLFNSIVWGNTAGSEADISGSSRVYHSCAPTLVPGVYGNISTDPEFLNPAHGDFRLSATSPCVDAGTNGYVVSLLDLDGNQRIMDGDFIGGPLVDMGAYEFPVVSVEVDIKPGSDTNPINMKSKGRTPVAVLTTEAFDVSEINMVSIRFAGAAPVHHAFEDVDCDGDIDLILHFNTRDLRLWSTSTFALLLGQTQGGVLLGGSDGVLVMNGEEEPLPPPPPVPELTLVPIPAGTNAGTDPDFGPYSLAVDAFMMSATEMPIEIWNMVYAWAVTNGYSFTNPGLGKAPGHPVYHMSWYDCAKWCNALSEMERLQPCYIIGGVIYRGGEAMPSCDFDANGYRLPTNDEWEYAARGGLVGQRFAWGGTITHSDANYNSAGSHTYDLSPTSGFHPAYYNGGEPYTSPAGSFAPNGYGLYDISGNLREWVDVTVGSVPSLRGGAWIDQADYNRIGPSLSYGPTFADRSVGFRVAQTAVTE